MYGCFFVLKKEMSKDFFLYFLSLLFNDFESTVSVLFFKMSTDKHPKGAQYYTHWHANPWIAEHKKYINRSIYKESLIFCGESFPSLLSVLVNWKPLWKQSVDGSPACCSSQCLSHQSGWHTPRGLPPLMLPFFIVALVITLQYPPSPCGRGFCEWWMHFNCWLCGAAKAVTRWSTLAKKLSPDSPV